MATSGRTRDVLHVLFLLIWSGERASLTREWCRGAAESGPYPCSARCERVSVGATGSAVCAGIAPGRDSATCDTVDVERPGWQCPDQRNWAVQFSWHVRV